MHLHHKAQGYKPVIKRKYGKWEMKHKFYFHTSKQVIAKNELKNINAILYLPHTF